MVCASGLGGDSEVPWRETGSKQKIFTVKGAVPGQGRPALALALLLHLELSFLQTKGFLLFQLLFHHLLLLGFHEESPALHWVAAWGKTKRKREVKKVKCSIVCSKGYAIVRQLWNPVKRNRRQTYCTTLLEINLELVIVVLITHMFLLVSFSTIAQTLMRWEDQISTP